MEQGPTVITGIGIVSALGLGKAENWANLCAGRSGVGPVRGFDATQLPARIASQVPERFDEHLRGHFPRSLLKRTARFTHFCLAASRMAIEDAGLELARENPKRIGVVVGNQGFGLKVVDDEIARALAHNPNMHPADWWHWDFDPMAVLKVMGNGCAAQASIFFGLEGPSFTIGVACASGAAAVCAADDMLRLGKADVVLVGGSEALVSAFTLLGFGRMETLSRRNEEPERASRPFDRDRDGFVLGEAAGMIILETAEHARRRGADVYARVLGHSMTSEAFDIFAPTAASAQGGIGMARTMTTAMAAARIAPDEVDYVSAHGTSTVSSDLHEVQAIKRAFGDHAHRLCVSSQKSMLGHSIGAAGAIETAVTALTIKQGVVTPTINQETPDPACDLDVVPNVARERRVRVALTNSFGFGGHNASIVLGTNGGHA
jgi:3-oxoacyl-[acyl-carrier-protein] synthase II